MTAREMEACRLAITNADTDDMLVRVRDQLLQDFPEDHGATSLIQCADIRRLSLHSPLPLHHPEQVWTNLTPYQEQEVLGELKFQLEVARAAMNDFLAPTVAGHGSDPIARRWQFVYGVLGAASRISQILFSRELKDARQEIRNKTAVGRALFIRNALGVGADDPLLNRSARHHLEHFDERLDRLLAQGEPMHFDRDIPAKNPLDPEIMPRISRAIVGGGRVIVMGEEYDLNAIIAAADALRDRIKVRQDVITEIVFRQL